MYIDPHVHCRDGKQAYKETVKHALLVAQRAGVDAIFDMPNTDPPIINEKLNTIINDDGTTRKRIKFSRTH